MRPCFGSLHFWISGDVQIRNSSTVNLYSQKSGLSVSRRFASSFNRNEALPVECGSFGALTTVVPSIVDLSDSFLTKFPNSLNAESNPVWSRTRENCKTLCSPSEPPIGATFLVHEFPCIPNDIGIGWDAVLFNEGRGLVFKIKLVISDGASGVAVHNKCDIRQKIDTPSPAMDCRDVYIGLNHLWGSMGQSCGLSTYQVTSASIALPVCDCARSINVPYPTGRQSIEFFHKVLKPGNGFFI